MEEHEKFKREVHRIDGKLYDIFIVMDNKGNEVQRINVPLKVEVGIHDFLEIMVGASILAVPIAFTQEVWDMGDQLAWINVLVLSLIGMLFLGTFIYVTSYRKRFTMYRNEYFKRVISTYLLSVLIIGLLLTVVDKCPWITDFDVALKRVLIGAFPASMSATVTDNITS